MAAIASIPTSGRDPCAARPWTTISCHEKPLCAIASWMRSKVGSATMAASAGTDRATDCAPIDANSSSQTAATTTSPATPRSAAAAAATMIAASPAFMS